MPELRLLRDCIHDCLRALALDGQQMTAPEECIVLRGVPFHGFGQSHDADEMAAVRIKDAGIDGVGFQTCGIALRFAAFGHDVYRIGAAIRNGRVFNLKRGGSCSNDPRALGRRGIRQQHAVAEPLEGHGHGVAGQLPPVAAVQAA